MELNKLYNMDCLEGMKQLPDESIDCVVTDCPYHIVSGVCSSGTYGNGNGISCKEPAGVLTHRREEKITKTHAGVCVGNSKHIHLYGLLNDNIEATRQGKLFKYNDIQFDEWLPEVYRVLKPKTHCYIMINARNLKDLQVSAEKAGFEFQQLLVWKKNNSTPNRYYLNTLEFILMLRKGAARNINNMGTTNCLAVNNIIGKKQHPTEKPVSLMRIMVENSTNKGDIVLDPFAGAGSTLIAAKQCERNYIGYEIDEQYYNIAEQRLRNEYRQQTLF